MIGTEVDPDMQQTPISITKKHTCGKRLLLRPCVDMNCVSLTRFTNDLGTSGVMTAPCARAE